MLQFVPKSISLYCLRAPIQGWVHLCTQRCTHTTHLDQVWMHECTQPQSISTDVQGVCGNAGVEEAYRVPAVSLGARGRLCQGILALALTPARAYSLPAIFFIFFPSSTAIEQTPQLQGGCLMSQILLTALSVVDRRVSDNWPFPPCAVEISIPHNN